MTVQYLELTDDERATLTDVGALLEQHFEELLGELLEVHLRYDELAGTIPSDQLVPTLRGELEQYVRVLKGGHLQQYLEGVGESVRRRTQEGGRYESLVVGIQGRQSAVGRVMRRAGMGEGEITRVRRPMQKLGQIYLTRAAAAYLESREQTIVAQQEAIRSLSTPVVEVWDGILALPLVGTIDTARARQITQALLRTIRDTQARIAILDITGVPDVDTQTANHLMKTIRAARLLGTQGMLVGISPEIADTLVGLDVDLGEVETYFSLRQGLLAALGRLSAASPAQQRAGR